MDSMFIIKVRDKGANRTFVVFAPCTDTAMLRFREAMKVPEHKRIVEYNVHEVRDITTIHTTLED